MDQPTTGGPPCFVLYAFETPGSAANAGKFVEFFISNPAQPLYLVSSACSFVLHCLEHKTYDRNLAKTPSASNHISFPFWMDVAGRNHE